MKHVGEKSVVLPAFHKAFDDTILLDALLKMRHHVNLDKITQDFLVESKN